MQFVSISDITTAAAAALNSHAHDRGRVEMEALYQFVSSVSRFSPMEEKVTVA